VTTEVEAVIRDLAVQLYPEPPFTGDDPLWEGEWDSLQLEQLIALIEEHYLILLDREDTARGNFANVQKLTRVVERRIAAWAAQA
jgi:acyl carrier protein